MNIRNYFLILTGAMLMLGACGSNGGSGEPPVTPQDSVPTVPETKGDVVVLVTTETRGFDLTEQSAELKSGSSMAQTNIRLNPNEQYQEIDGFGAAITGSTCYNLMQMSAADRAKFLTETFSPSKYGFSYVRISIGCSDFSLSEFTCCDKEGIENFALQSEDKEYVIPILKEILAINPQLKIMGTPWTCPRWMKVEKRGSNKPYNSWTSGSLNPKYYQDYATYFVKWIQVFKAEGIDIYSITPQNEPLNKGNSASLYMEWDEERDFVKVLGKAMRDANIDTKIFVFDHNYNYDNISSQTDYPVNIYDDAEASQYITGAAYHNYGGNKSELLDIHNKAPQKQLVFSETSIGEWNKGRDLKARLIDDMKEVAIGTVNNWCRGVIVWNLMLDSDKGPNRPDGGCQTCYGAVDISVSDFKTITRNSHYYILAHMASVVKPGAVRIATSGYTDSSITFAAFLNTDNTYGFVIANEANTAKRITISSEGKYFSYEFPARSVTSLKWAK